MDQVRDVSGAGAATALGVAAGPQGISGVRVLNEHGGFTQPTRVGWNDGRFTADSASQNGDSDGAGSWLIPGLVDAHVHASWHAFDASDREQLSPDATLRATTAGLSRTLAAGVTSVRDAGGLDAETLAAIPAIGRPRVQLSVSMLDRAAADAAGGLDCAVERALAAGAQWIKLVATAGVASPQGAGLEPVFTAAEMRDAVRRADSAGAGVMVHAWGGTAIDHAIGAGARSIEHGIFLTREQAERAAVRGLTLVPTLRIYHLVAEMIAAGSLPQTFRARVAEATAAHPGAVRLARDAGLAIAVGTDSGTPDQHGTAKLEVDALVAAGLTPQEALLAATRSGAALLASVGQDSKERARSSDDRLGGGAQRTGDSWPGGSEPDGPGLADQRLNARGSSAAPSRSQATWSSASRTPWEPLAAPGTISPGAPADAVLLRRDPREPGALSDPAAVVGVLLGGTWHHVDLGRAPDPDRDPEPT